MNKENLQKFYLKYRLYIFPVVIVISSLILIVFVIYPQITKLISNNALESDLKDKSKLLEVKAQTLENYDKADLERKVNYTLNAYPAERDFTNIIGLLQGLSAGSGFNVNSLTLGGSSQPEAKSYNVKLEILGPKSLLPNLVSNIENSVRIMKVASIELTPTKDFDLGQVNLSVEVFFAALPQTFGTVDSPLPTLSDKEEELLVKLAASAPAPVATSQVAPSGPRGKANPFE